MSLVNVAYSAVLTWSRPHVRSLEQQVLVPLLAGKPVELGLGGKSAQLLGEFRTDRTYQSLFPEAFPGERAPFTTVNMAKAIAAFERSIISARSPYDRYRYGGEENAISDSAKRGEVLFFTDSLAGCYRHAPGEGRPALIGGKGCQRYEPRHRPVSSAGEVGV